MTIHEAIEYMETFKISYNHIPEIRKVFDIATESMEKDIPYKPKTDKLKWGVGRCKCGAEFLDKFTNYCGNCGQRLDWTERSHVDEKTEAD